MKRLLAIDTATEACSVALIIGDEVIGRFERVGNRHSERVLPMVEAVLAEAGLKLGELDAVGLSRGPGSFTGVRIGTAVAQGLAFGAALPVIPVSTLALLACGAGDVGGPVLAAMDARMGEVYWACYQNQGDGVPVPLVEEQLGPAAGISPPVRPVLALGSGVGAWPMEFKGLLAEGGVLDGDHCPDARRMGPLLRAAGPGISAERVAPVYLRNKVADKPAR